MDVGEKQAWLIAERERRDWSPAELAKRAQPFADAAGYAVKFNQQLIWNFENTAKKVPGWFRFAEAALRDNADSATEVAPTTVDDNSALFRHGASVNVMETVGIRFSDADFGLGATFADDAPSIEVLQFPKAWVESITFTSPALLSWVRARGSSMRPTINDGDMILLDHSQRKVADQDDIWAFTVGDTRAIKRLRVKGDRYQILSDNAAVPDDEEPIDFVNIVGRVILVGTRT